MKKRLFALLLALATLFSLTVVPAWAADVAVTENLTDPDATVCGCGCGKKLSEVEWKTWTGEVASGHFYLTRDYTAAEQINVISGESMVIDLRGYTITTASRVRTFLVNGYLGVLDTVGGGRISGRTVSGENGGLVSVVDNETSGSTFELYSGTLTPASDAGKPNAGGLINLGDGATFRMHDGLLLNGVTGTGSSKNGGAISAGATSTIEILGGSIVGCSADAVGGSIYSGGTVTLKNCYIVGGTAGTTGGNLYISGTLTAENCIIADGTAMSTGTYGGGNINTASGSKLTFTNCEIRGGYCPGYGGNISFGWGTQTLTNTRVYGGTAGKGGDNIALTHSSANMTLDGCTVDGGMSRILGKLTLKGATKIALTSGGLDLSEQSSKTTTATGLSAGAEVYVSGDKTITGSLDYIKPALQTTLTADGTTLTVAPAADGVTAGYCPHCNAQVAWQPYGTANATHTYLTADQADFAETAVESDLVIDLRGFDITAAGRAFNVAATGSLTLIDDAGSVITGSGVAGENGSVILNAGTLKIYGGKYVYAAGNVVGHGGIIYTSGNFEMYNAILDASAYANTAANGGAICTDGGVTVVMKGGRVIGGSANYGGGAYFAYNNTLTIENVTFTGGTALTGGNVSAQGTSAGAQGTLIMTGVSVLDGKATGEYAGNLYLGRYKTCSITDSYLAGGSTKLYGGNFSVGLGTNATFTQCIIEGGSSDSKGGQVYVPGNSGYLTLDRCLMTNGTAPEGGNINLNNGTCTVKGGEVSHGTATAGNGGNIYAGTDDKTGVTLTADAEGNAPLVCRGTAADRGGNIFAGDIVNVDAARFSGGVAPNGGNDLYVNGTGAAVVLGSGVTGDVYMNASSGLLTENVYGGAISNVTCQTTDANFYLDGAYGNCGTLVKDETIYVATTAVVDKAGNAVWYSSNADAVEACDEGSYVKLFTGDDLVLTKDLYVDINGQTVTASGYYKLYGMDSTGDGYTAPAGTVILNGVDPATVITALNGNTYIGIGYLGDMTYHRLDMKITGVTIRPSSDGMYYSAKWACDDVLKAKIDTFGVVASTANMPGADFASEEENLWTTFNQDSFVSGQTKNGAVISDIMSETADDNDERGKAAVYAKAYITFTDGTSLVSNDNIRFSLYDVMKNLDRLIVEKPIQYRKFNLSARNFYETWKDNGMGDWALTKIPKPADDGVIDVLMVGSSFCYYYVEELYELGQAAGIDIRVCNLYYSGCPLEKHYNWWVGGNSNYQYYETFHDGRNLTSNVSLEWGLAQHEWDFISIQESSGKTATDGAQLHYEVTKQYWEPLVSYFLEQFPDAQVLWHQVWVNQFQDHQKEGTVIKSPEDQVTNTQILEDYAKLITGYFNDGQAQTLVQRVPSGRAWQNVRDNGYDFLCCRLNKTNPVTGVAHAGDGYHEGDIGGGQYLNACVWFEIITGQSVLGNTYIPEYKTTATLADSLLAQVQVVKTENGYALTPELVALLQQAAHDAVETTGLVITE